MPKGVYKDPEYQSKYYPKWYAKNGRNRAVNYMDGINNWKEKHPEAIKAHKRVFYAVKTGKIIKPKECSQCDKIKRLSGHHEDYNKPLEVLWLCYSCHKLKHRLDIHEEKEEYIQIGKEVMKNE